ncbi:hypothetical protein NUW58_g8329 [Xylaria curta]|uniref:Uncharacterized protein n=1 Tax=Xylaria curta TaxID=42375 RepID=A0ACC1N8E5_9PEZI|nr:hypothetical protein NUW58_g8329 [Xylaria curta]
MEPRIRVCSQPDHCHSQSYDDARVYEKRQELAAGYESDDEHERRPQCSKKRERSPLSQPPSVLESAARQFDSTRVPRSRQVPSPPPLNRNRSTGTDRPSHSQGTQQNSQIEQDELSHCLSPNNAQESHKYESSHPAISSPTLAYPPTTSIIVSEASQPDGSQSCHSGCSYAKNPAAGSYADSTFQLASSVSLSSRAFRKKAYQYEQLRPFEFRLVQIFAKRGPTVECQIIHSSRAEPPPYIAISYAWGDVGDRRTIQIGKCNIDVAVSLFGALDAVRKWGEDVLVWVDALCIDQQNPDERSQQVQLMTEIYAKATEVAIWLGPTENDSQLAKDFIQDIILAENNPEETTALLLSPSRLPAVEAVVRLFQRDYWRRLWVVQEVFNARSIMVYCGDSAGLPWGVYRKAAQIFRQHKKYLDYYFPASLAQGSKHQLALQSSLLNYSRVLAYEGPNSLLDLDSVNSLGDESLLNVMRAFRRKLTIEPRDRIFGILGVLPEAVRREFPVDYNLSVKEIYTNVVNFLLNTTERLDVICESIHFPKQYSLTNLPSWVPDWSLNPDITALGYYHDFAAASDTNADWAFVDERRNELEVSAVYVDTVWKHGIAVGTLCTLADYLMAFLHWRAILLDAMSLEKPELREEMEEVFCRTLCLGQVPPEWGPGGWVARCYRVFATQIRNRLPRMPIDEDLSKYVDAEEDAEWNHRQFLQSHFGSRMMGRCFFLTRTNHIGMGTGLMLPDDVIIVPLGCRTPIIIRQEGDKRSRRFRYVGDAYLDGYMDGKAIEKWKTGEKDIEKFVLV